MNENHQEYFRNYHFALKIGETDVAYFTRVSGLGVKVSYIEYREGGMPNTVRKLPGQTSVAPITLEWGVTCAHDMWDWMMHSVNGVAEPKQVSIIILGNTSGEEKTRWNLSNAWPSEWLGTELDASGNNVAIESMVLQAEAVERMSSANAASSEE